MFTWGSRNILFAALFAWLGALVHGLTTGGSIVGVLSMGYKGAIGDHVGYSMLIGVSIAALFLGVVSIATREGNAEDMAALAGSDRALAVRPPRKAAYWGPLVAFGVACLALGLAVGKVFMFLGLAVLAVAVLEWTALAWSDRATGDDEVNSIIRSRILSPFEVPILGLLGIAVVVLGFSRIFLAVPELAATVLASVAALFVFGSAVFIAKSRAPRSVISAIVAFGAVAVLASGVIGAARGERDFHHGEDGGHSEVEDHSEEGEG